MSLILNVKSILMNSDYMIMHHMYQERVLNAQKIVLPFSY